MTPELRSNPSAYPEVTLLSHLVTTMALVGNIIARPQLTPFVAKTLVHNLRCTVTDHETRLFASFLADGKFSYLHTSATSIGAERGLAIILLRI